MSYLAEKVGDAYASTKQEGYSSAEAYKFAAREAIKLGAKARCSKARAWLTPAPIEAIKLGAKARCSSTANTQYPTIVFDMPDASQAKLMYGGVLHSEEEYWHDC